MYIQNDQGKCELWLEVIHLRDPERMIVTIAIPQDISSTAGMLSEHRASVV